MSDLRTTPSLKPPVILDTKPPFSNFQYIENRFGSLDSIHRIFSQVRLRGFQTLISEEIGSVGFSGEDDLELVGAGIKPFPDSLVRLSFFSAEIKDASNISSVENHNFLGYAILKKIPAGPSSYIWIVFESVITVCRHENNYLHKLRKYNVNIGGTSFTVTGVLYCQQNQLTNVCAHAALRTCISLVTPPGDISYSRMNQILTEGGMSHGISEGLGIEQICLILNKLDIKYSLFSLEDAKPDDKEPPQDKKDTAKDYIIPYQYFLYSSIESGFPALLGFSLEKGGHIIPVFGHTFNEDTWVPKANASYFEIGKDTRYIPSETWVSSYVCHDDNFGSYYCLPRYYLSNKNNPTVIAIRPNQAEYDAISAEAIAADYLYTLYKTIEREGKVNFWAKRLGKAISEKGGWFVLRTLCMSKEDYIEHLRLLKGWDNKTIPAKLITALNDGLPKLLWVAEISLPELFSANKRKLGEIVLDANKPVGSTQDLANFVLARILNKIYCLEKSEKGIGLIENNAEIDTHTDLYSNIAW